MIATQATQRSAPPVEVLLVEDDPADLLLTRRALDTGKFANNLSIAKDDVEALEVLRRCVDDEDAVLPDLILLDLNMPRMDGRETLAAIKSDPDLRRIPVVILTTSDQDEDILRSYELQANCYISKPIDMNQLAKVVKSIEEFWFTIVKLPPRF